jgi:hypothetical protein
MDNSPPSDNASYREINLSAEVKKMWGKEWNQPEVEYEFSNGRTFKRRTEEAGIYDV